MSFKVKTKNRNPINTKQTLDAVHSNIIDNFQLNKSNISKYKKEKEILTNRIDQLNEKIKTLKTQAECMLLQREIWDLDDKRKELEELIYNIENNIDEKKYLLETGNILKQYYNINDEEEPKNINNNVSSKKKRNKKTVLDWIEHDTKKNIYYDLNTGNAIINIKNKESKNKEFISNEDNNIDILENNNTSQINDTENMDNMDNINHLDNLKIQDNSDLKNNTDSNLSLLSKLNNEKTKNQITNSSKTKIQNITSKKKLYEIFMMTIDNDSIIENNSDNEEDINDICEICNNEMLLEQNTGTLLCSTCGILEQVLIDSDKPSYKDPPKEVTSFCYKRINHLNEFLAQFQAKETTDIPEEIYDEILVEIKKQRINNMADITPDKMRLILRKIKRNDYYEHVPYIINQLNGLPPPVISPEVEEIIRNMFKEIQVPFEKFCPKKRKNFLSYNYVMYKFFELLELDEYLSCFQLLKSRNKLHQQDLIWKNICHAIKWQFIPSL